jgi:hypothetical protein
MGFVRTYKLSHHKKTNILFRKYKKISKKQQILITVNYYILTAV